MNAPTITRTTTQTFARGRRLFSCPAATAYAAVDASTGAGIRGMMWVEVAGELEPQLGEGPQFRHLFAPAAERRAVR